jgi:putative transcriptional regulator
LTQSLAGQLLIAPADLDDPDFVRTVVLVIQHSQEKAFGVIVNRPASRTVREAWSGKGRPDNGPGLWSGGPVPGPLVALHDDPSLAELEVLSGVYYAVQKKNLEKLLKRPCGLLKMFDGHSGWGPGQLERWIEAGRWVVATATPETVFDSLPGLWERVARLA